jgi:para-aminobenzoate synthetase component 1
VAESALLTSEHAAGDARFVVGQTEPGLDAWQAFLRLRDQAHPFFLDSADPTGELGRYSFVGCDPAVLLRCTGRAWTIVRRDGTTVRGTENPFAVLRRLLGRYRVDPASGPPVPFIGGAVGYLGYDLKNSVERLPSTAVRDTQLPDLHFAFYDTVSAVPRRGPALLIAWDHPEIPDADSAEERVRRLADVLARPGAPEPGSFECGSPASNVEPDAYLDAVRAAKEYIAAGDIFQVNLSQRFQARFQGDPIGFYGRLRQTNPAPFACCLPLAEGVVCSSSPERFLKVSGRHVETCPIKGTRRRGRSPAEDAALAAELLASEKDRAELTMIIDLERNDLGRVCEYGSVVVSDACRLETHPTVFHLVGTICGVLYRNYELSQLLRATFPGGSITGAPKIRAMEIIDELEPTARSVYTGSIGYIGFDGAADLNIAIRTAVITGGQVYVQVGGGIVADSDPQLEYEETLHKGEGLFQALRGEGASF